MPLLETVDLVAGYGSVPALHGVSLRIEPGEIVALLGRNGAGKTTLLRAIAGIIAPMGGSVFIDGAALPVARPEVMAAAGVQLLEEGGGVLRSLSVEENLVLAGWVQNDRPAALRARLDEACTLFPRLGERRRQAAGTLSGGERQMLAIAQTVMRDSRVVLIDEASLGLAPTVVEVLFEAIAGLRTSSRSVLLVEQNADSALAIADRWHVLQQGHLTDGGSTRDVDLAAVHAAYLGIGA